ncbi:MAG TPA: DUF72 domain-containing protein [Kofleriaceae bacterium]|nr:DUF72 domain-containing protein [Kofleriaceae bacterium]
MIRGYYLGCPGWSMKTWVGRLFPPGTRATEFLPRYADVFNTVEGNTTFYALPTAETVERWGAQVPDGFRFCFKFPRTITHDKQLVGCDAEVDEFIARIAPLGHKLGTLFIQLPPSFGDAARLAAFLDRLPRAFRYAVEPRLADITAFDALLAERGVDAVILDTRGIHASHSLEHAETRARKPNLPVVARATAQHPFVRCVPHETFAESRPLVDGWAEQVAAWIRTGKTPYFFMHAPDDTFAPENAYDFHAMLRARGAEMSIDVGELPKRPGAPRQQSLF